MEKMDLPEESAVPQGVSQGTPLGASPGTSQGSPHSTPHGTSLSERDVTILDFERQWWRHAGSKEQAIRDRFAVSAVRYYQLLNALLDNPEAMAYDPVLVKRLRRLRASRRRARGATKPFD